MLTARERELRDVRRDMMNMALIPVSAKCLAASGRL
jgi:hypothetical protein